MRGRIGPRLNRAGRRITICRMGKQSGTPRQTKPAEKSLGEKLEAVHASTQAYIDDMCPRCVELARVLKKTGSFFYHCDWHAIQFIHYKKGA